MYTKKWLGLFLFLVMALGMLSGCSPVEKEYYKLTMEAGGQKVFEEKGTIELNAAQLPEDIFEGEDVFSKELVQKALNQHRIDYWGKTDLNQGIFEYNLVIVDNLTGEKNGFLSILYQNDVFYIKVDDLISYMKQFCNAEDKQEIDKVFGDTKYISLSNKDLESLVAPDAPNIFNGNLLENSIQQQMIWRKLFDVLINNAYDEYDSHLVSKSGNKYTFTLRGAEVSDTMKPMAIYSINNMDKLGAALKSFFNGLSQEEIRNIGLTSEQKKELLTAVDEMVLDVNQNRTEYLQAINQIPPEAQNELNEVFSDSELVATIEKIDAHTYNSSCMARIHSSIESPSQELDISLSIKKKIITGATVQISAPEGKITTIKELEKRMPKTMVVWVDDDYYTLDKGFGSSEGDINIKTINNQTFLPLRQIAETMDEKVGWDVSTRQAFVERNGQNINMTGIVIDNACLVKCRDFEKLGYKISWNDSDRTVTIEK